MSIYANAVSAERAAKIAQDIADHEAGIDALRRENAELRAALYDEQHGVSFHLRDAERQRYLKALTDCVSSLRGYRRELSDGQPCDAEKAAVAILTQNAPHEGTPRKKRAASLSMDGLGRYP